MTDTEKKHFIALQPVIREKMGPLRHLDKGIGKYGEGIVWRGEFYYTDLQFSNASLCVGSHPEIIRLPLPIDSVNPERGCWFMLTKENRTDKVFLSELALSDNPTLVILKKLANQEKAAI